MAICPRKNTKIAQKLRAQLYRYVMLIMPIKMSRFLKKNLTLGWSPLAKSWLRACKRKILCFFVILPQFKLPKRSFKEMGSGQPLRVKMT